MLWMICLLAVGPCNGIRTGQQKQVEAFEVFGYHTWWMEDAWKSYDYSLLHTLFFFDLEAMPDGTFGDTNGWPGAWAGLIDAAHQTGTQLIPTITLFGKEDFNTLFLNEDAVALLLENTLAAAQMAHADGIHIDFEVFDQVEPEARNRFTRFIGDLDQALDSWKEEARLIVFLPAFDQVDAFDEYALSLHADQLLVQGYDLHWLTAPTAGPVAPIEGWSGLNWNAILERYESMAIPGEKLVFSVPLYGYEWPTESPELGAKTRGPGTILHFNYSDSLQERPATLRDRRRRHGVRRDPESGSAFYIYQGEDGWYQGWYEDEESLLEKYKFVAEKGIGGVALFALGYDQGELMELLLKSR